MEQAVSSKPMSAAEWSALVRRNVHAVTLSQNAATAKIRAAAEQASATIDLTERAAEPVAS